MGINGFGRIGRLVFRAASGNPDAEAAVGLWCQRWKMAIEVVIFSWKMVDFPMKNCDWPIENGDLP